MDFDQLNIWSFVEEDYPEIETSDIAEIAEIIGRKLNLTFALNDYIGDYETRIGEYELSINKSVYSCDHKKGQPCILVNYMRTCKDYAGCGMAVDSIEEAVDFFEKHIRKTIEREETFAA